MKKKLASVSLLLLAFAANAQNMTTTTTRTTIEKPAYNKWSLELNGGINKPTRTMTPGYATATLNPFHADLGVRYMFNPKFGLKLDVGYDQFQERDETAPFESRSIRTSLQGVVNIGRALNFETWTNTIGILAHGGFGVSQLTSDNGFDGKDYMGNGILGLTGQLRLSDRVALTGDLTGIVNGRQNHNFDGMSPTSTGSFDGVLLNASVGLTFYLGKNTKHADWYSEENERLNNLEDRVTTIETGLIDTDKDGVADLYDLEPNSVNGVAVNTKGQAIDTNQNGVPDELESYLEKTYGQNGKGATNTTVEELINGGYVNVYFDFNASKPTNASLSGVDFIVKYLKNNPGKSADIIGYSDEIGSSSYNTELSRKRAEAVKSIAIDAGIDASRLNVIANGEDTSVNKNSNEARQIVRRVTFRVK
ncbi:OmpA family protein [Flavobacterium sp. Fl-77]|uniref:OmpA family protein n=1 Tax=Flavobacterium flavipigmentatum TaxID=2893884 RepID=A0AAJ2SCW2_9FLAO|nr:MULTISPECIES: OmpA family protein [unclassified Flavobacterium]MDX6181469.1 OmpA family protein [Flavobacterium sp. Fl-33]MDX6185497.1 OmpA family protein [Flavobacterium sp. Fl-77]UFH37600.1 OmpA family protein [Flavobacterium sp. F-70]